MKGRVIDVFEEDVLVIVATFFLLSLKNDASLLTKFKLKEVYIFVALFVFAWDSILG